MGEEPSPESGVPTTQHSAARVGPPEIALGRWRAAGRGRIVAVAVLLALVGLALSQWLPDLVLRGLRAENVRLSLLGVVAASALATDLVGFGLTSVGYLWLRGRGPGYVRVRRPTVRDAWWMLGGLAVLLVLYGLVVSVATGIGIRLAGSYLADLGTLYPSVFVELGVLSFVLIGPIEELFFRGLVQETMREALPPVQAVVVASVTFAAVHYLSIEGSFVGKLAFMGSLFVTSLVLGAVYEWRRNLLVNATIHGAYNAALLFGAYALLTAGIPVR